MNVAVGISNRHVHLNQEDYEVLFGDEPLNKEKDLNQYGEFSCNQFVDLITDEDTIKDVRVLGPLRSYTQVEISKTDSYLLDINPPVRNSGDLIDSETITIKGPKGSIKKNDCCIIATRHIHISDEKAEKYGFKNNDIVSVRVNTEKSCIMNDVYIKAGNYYFEMHIDTDDANANLLKNGDVVEIIK